MRISAIAGKNWQRAADALDAVEIPAVRLRAARAGGGGAFDCTGWESRMSQTAFEKKDLAKSPDFVTISKT